MILCDSHCHLHMINYDEIQSDLGSAIQQAKDQNVLHMLCVGTDLNDVPKIIEIAEQYSEVNATIGLHPNEAVEEEPNIAKLVKLADHPKVVAIGETGLDYYRTPEKEPWQQERFRNHIRAAIETSLPLIIHSRMAREDTLKILKEEKASTVGGVFHCFTEDWATAEKAMDLGFYISFSGIVTFKNAVELQEVAKKIPLDRMLIETDAPYLAPVPYRGKMNQPAYVRYVAEFIAKLRERTIEDIAHNTTQNYKHLFGV